MIWVPCQEPLKNLLAYELSKKHVENHPFFCHLEHLGFERSGSFRNQGGELNSPILSEAAQKRPQNYPSGSFRVFLPQGFFLLELLECFLGNFSVFDLAKGKLGHSINPTRVQRIHF